MLTQKRTQNSIVLSLAERKQFASFVQLLMTIDKRVAKETKQQKQKLKRPKISPCDAGLLHACA